MSGVAGLMLAAGASSRLGRPKQLLDVAGDRLVSRSTQLLLESGCDAVFVVVGAHAAGVARALAGLDVEVVHNEDWSEGIASSIRCGLAAVVEQMPACDAVLVCAADQPLVTASLLGRLVDTHRRTGSALVACEYAGTVGVPALFGRRYFESLRALGGDRGAKSVLASHASELTRIAFEPASVDLDTEADVRAFRGEPV